ncbi:hypothetical protein SPAB_05589 [Salmonella enterica subsp. enterica serovar Paratyphi B str. SPB7]|uniref:Uncharacterized protein n=1 Tax=Salmonella paratyphi B (strain ATCC BAA-1250 / SPB7) TaxID=1016998 RepID=A0A6C6Z9Q0_SALPB|nr:hypothetical protein SPAB_05589 [Salmonella enterica subsp. enterica serovar Paratyphi B str. SPB7]
MAASLYPQVAIRQNVIPITLSHFIRQRHCLFLPRYFLFMPR